VYFSFSIYVRSLFSTNHALRRHINSRKPIGKKFFLLQRQRLGERFFPLSSKKKEIAVTHPECLRICRFSLNDLLLLSSIPAISRKEAVRY
jgi:hypothetical protein